MKKVIITLVSLTLMGSVFAQNDVQKKMEGRIDKAETEIQDHEARLQKLEKKVKVTPYGFVRNYFNYDSRNTYVSNGGEYNMIPYDEKWNGSQADCDLLGVERADMNAVPQAHFLALTTRIGLKLAGPDVLGAKTSGQIEGDFGGFSTTNSIFRIRHAYLKLNWDKNDGALRQELLAGQTWHPLSGDIMPEVLGMAAGAPFRAHSRTPQLRYTMYSGSGFGITAAALYQLQYMYNGPSYSDGKWSSTNSTSFANQAVVPELFLGVQYKDDHIYTQIGSTCQTIRPRTFGYVTKTVGEGDDAVSKTMAVPVDELLTTFTPTFYFQYTNNLFAAKFRTIYAQNTSHVNQINGYGVTNVLEDGTWEYAPMRATISYLNFAYGKKYRADLFFGYMKNLGAAENLHDFGGGKHYIYMKGGENFTNLGSIFRIAPSLSYNLPHFNFGLEYEWTACAYGEQDANGSILDNEKLHTVANHRVCALIKYNF